MNSIQDAVYNTVNGSLKDEPFIEKHCNPISGWGLAQCLRDLESLGYAKCDWKYDFHTVHPEALHYFYRFNPDYADHLTLVLEAKKRLTQNS
jgi:hypothetical protein